MIRSMYEKPYAYDVLLDEENGEWFLDVLCGGIAMYDVAIQLSPDEVETFKRDPTALEYLVGQILRAPDKFSDRTVLLYYRNGRWERHPE